MNLEKATVTIPYTEFQKHQQELEEAQKIAKEAKQAKEEYTKEGGDKIIALGVLLHQAMRSSMIGVDIASTAAEMGFEMETKPLHGTDRRLVVINKKR